MMNRKIWVATAALALQVSLLIGALASALSQTASPPDTKLVKERLAEQKKPRQEVKIDPKLFDNYVGYYQLDPQRVYTVKREGDALFVQLTGQDSLQVFPESRQKFFYREVTAQLSFNVDAQGRATGLILHQGGMEKPAPRIDEAEAQKLEAAFVQRIKDEKPMAGSEAALKHQIEAFEQGQPAYDDMAAELATATRPQIPRINRRFALLGPLQSLSFRGVGFSGWDVYEARFTNGMAICRIMLAPDGKVSGLLFQWGP